MPAPLSATQLRPRSRSAVAATAAGDATVTQEPYPETSVRQKIRCDEQTRDGPVRCPVPFQLMVPVPLSRRAASAMDPVIEG
jgi:hypothetical protein